MPLELFPARLPLILSGRLALPTFGMYLLCRRRLDVREFRVGQACVPEIPAANIPRMGMVFDQKMQLRATVLRHPAGPKEIASRSGALPATRRPPASASRRATST